jgi:D-proline reductase (dithiol) PrdB
MAVIEQLDSWQKRYAGWKARPQSRDDIADYPFVENVRSPFTPLRRALPMLNLALISSAGAFIEGTEAFDTVAAGGDLTFREIPSEIDLNDLRYAARGYDVRYLQEDPNVQIPLARLTEFRANRVIGQLAPAFWSFCGFIPDAARFTDEMLPRLVERLQRHEVQAALLIPASRLCHQSVALAARAIEIAGIPTIALGVERDVMELTRPPRSAYYAGQTGSVAGNPKWPEHQRRVLDEALRWLEPMGQPGIKKLTVELESQVEAARGER